MSILIIAACAVAGYAVALPIIRALRKVRT